MQNQKVAEATQEATPREPVYYPLNDTLAREAHRSYSMSPFSSDEAKYRAIVDEAYMAARTASKRCPGCADEAYGLADRYARKYAEWLNRGYSIEAMCPSILICGPANFPTRKKERQNAARDKHMLEYEKIEHLLENIQKIGTGADIIKAGDSDATDKLREKVERLEKKHEAMKQANAKARKNDETPPYPPWTLSNNRQNIAAAKRRVESIEAQKERGTKESEVVLKGERCQVVENAELMRLQLVFDAKPSDEVRAILKRNGFRWSSKNGAWQRQLNMNSHLALERLMENSDDVTMMF